MSIVEAAKYQITSAVYNAKDKVSNCQRSLPGFKSTVLSPRFSELLQATDILIAAAPINIKKQDLADLELGVSCLGTHAPTLSDNDLLHQHQALCCMAAST